MLDARKIGDLTAAISSARERASKIGPQHALWDVIADAESVLSGKRTIVDWGPRSSAFDRLTLALNATEPGRRPTLPGSGPPTVKRD